MIYSSVSNKIFSIIKYLFNISIQQGVFPVELKIACATPIFKNGDKSLLRNYRPISVMPTFSKLLKPIMYNRLFESFCYNRLQYLNKLNQVGIEINTMTGSTDT